MSAARLAAFMITLAAHLIDGAFGAATRRLHNARAKTAAQLRAVESEQVGGARERSLTCRRHQAAAARVVRRLLEFDVAEVQNAGERAPKRADFALVKTNVRKRFVEMTEVGDVIDKLVFNWSGGFALQLHFEIGQLFRISLACFDERL